MARARRDGRARTHGHVWGARRGERFAPQLVDLALACGGLAKEPTAANRLIPLSRRDRNRARVHRACSANRREEAPGASILIYAGPAGTIPVGIDVGDGVLQIGRRSVDTRNVQTDP